MITKQHYFGSCVTVSVLLGVWMDVASGMMSIQLIPQYPVIQGSVTLSVTGITGKIASSIWYKGSNPHSDNQILSYFPGTDPPVSTGPLYNSRMTPHPNGSLQISNLNISDEGNYTVRIQTDTAQNLRVYLKIYEMVGKPTIKASTSLPKENDAVTLNCTSTNAEMIIWSRVPSGATLSSDNRTVSFSRINRINSGNYQCEAVNLVSKRTSDLYTLTIAYGPENVKISGQSLENSAILLTCIADSVPSPSYQWFNGTNLSVQQNRFHIERARLENEWTYTCAIKNPVTEHTATASFYINADTVFCQTMYPFGRGLGGGEIASIVIGTVFGIFILEVIVYCVLKAKRNTPRSAVHENAHVPEQHNYENALPGIKEKTSQESNYEQLTPYKAIYSTMDLATEKY